MNSEPFPYQNFPPPEVTDAMRAAGKFAVYGHYDDAADDFWADLYRAMRLYRPLSEGPEP